MLNFRETEDDAGAVDDVARQQAKAVTDRDDLLAAALDNIMQALDGIDEKKDQADFIRDMKQARDLLRRYLPADRMGEQRIRRPRTGLELRHLLEQRAARR